MPGPVVSKAMADGIAVAEELPYKFLVDDGYGRRTKLVLGCETAAHNQVRTHGIKVLRGPFYPGRAFIVAGFSLNL